MKKMMILVLMLLAVTSLSHAQTFAEWFKQKKTQKKYLLNQIAALAAYQRVLTDGYGVVKTGLKAIDEIKNGEFDLHSLFFTSLKSVNPRIKKYHKVAEILRMQVDIMQIESATRNQLKTQANISIAENKYSAEVFQRLADDCMHTLDDLIAVVTNGSVEMNDQERLCRIDELWLDMQGQYLFAKCFSTDVKGLAAQKQREQNEINYLRSMYGLKQEP